MVDGNEEKVDWVLSGREIDAKNMSAKALQEVGEHAKKRGVRIIVNAKGDGTTTVRPEVTIVKGFPAPKNKNDDARN